MMRPSSVRIAYILTEVAGCVLWMFCAVPTNVISPHSSTTFVDFQKGKMPTGVKGQGRRSAKARKQDETWGHIRSHAPISLGEVNVVSPRGAEPLSIPTQCDAGSSYTQVG